MKNMIRTFFVCLVVMVVASCANMPKRNMDPSMLVIPSRYTIVQMAFDLARMRPITLVAYDKGRGSDKLLMHIWNPSLQEWVAIGMSEFSAGNLTEPRSSRVHVLGAREDLPEGIMQAAQWCPVVEQIDSLNIATILNSLHTSMQFSGSEWNKLAKRHNLSLEDRNWERRRYGKYGKPGSEGSVSVPMPSEEIVEEIVIEPMPPVNMGEEAAPQMVMPEDK